MPCIIFAALLMMASYARAMESDVYDINTNLLPGSARVCFSIGYPHTWGVADHYHYDYADIFMTHFNMVCLFYPTNALFSKKLTDYAVYSSDETTAKTAAKNLLKTPNFVPLSFNRVKTIAGDRGWLVESKEKLTVGSVKNPWVSQVETKEFPAICHSYFFDSGKKGSLCIRLITLPDDSSWRTNLDQLVLQTLRLNNN